MTQAILSYVQRPKGCPAYDVARLKDFMERIGEYDVLDAKKAWNEWLGSRGAKMAPATAARSRAILQAALSHGADALGYEKQRLPTVAQKPAEEGTVYLTHAEQERLLAAYNIHAYPVALTLCYQGMRTQEALRMDWRHVSLERGTIHIPAERTKTGRGRTVPMHWKVRFALVLIWDSRGRPSEGTVFHSSRGVPYADTRGLGGNPLTTAHKTACKKAGIKNFRVHDWRHNFASWLVMSGCDITTLMRLGGWSSPRMVQRYAAVSSQHLSDVIGKLR